MAFTSHGHQIPGTAALDRPENMGRARCGGPGLCKKCSSEAKNVTEALDAEKARTEGRQNSDDLILDPMIRALYAVAQYWNDGAEKYGDNPVSPSQLYIVMYAYILGGFKVLISSDAWTDTSYFEVTYNREKEELYVDHYRKVNQEIYKDSDDGALQMARLRKKLGA